MSQRLALLLVAAALVLGLLLGAHLAPSAPRPTTLSPAHHPLVSPIVPRARSPHETLAPEAMGLVEPATPADDPLDDDSTDSEHEELVPDSNDDDEEPRPRLPIRMVLDLDGDVEVMAASPRPRSLPIGQQPEPLMPAAFDRAIDPLSEPDPGFARDPICQGNTLCLLANTLGNGPLPNVAPPALSLYQASLADFRAGRFTEAAKGFAAVAAALPAPAATPAPAPHPLGADRLFLCAQAALANAAAGTATRTADNPAADPPPSPTSYYPCLFAASIPPADLPVYTPPATNPSTTPPIVQPTPPLPPAPSVPTHG